MALGHPSIFIIGGIMAVQKSFKERVKESVIQNACSYKEYFVDYEYLQYRNVCRRRFSKKPN